MDEPTSAWPPIITDARISRVLVWRDRLLTVGMWLLLLFLVQYALRVMGHERTGPGDNWTIWYQTLRPYLITASLLGVWLLISGLMTLRRIRRYAGRPQPESLSLAEEARRIGCSEDDLMAWRELRIATVHIEDDGRIRVEGGLGAELPVPAREVTARGTQ